MSLSRIASFCQSTAVWMTGLCEAFWKGEYESKKEGPHTLTSDVCSSSTEMQKQK